MSKSEQKPPPCHCRLSWNFEFSGSWKEGLPLRFEGPAFEPSGRDVGFKLVCKANLNKRSDPGSKPDFVGSPLWTPQTLRLGFLPEASGRSRPGWGLLPPPPPPALCPHHFGGAANRCRAACSAGPTEEAPPHPPHPPLKHPLTPFCLATTPFFSRNPLSSFPVLGPVRRVQAFTITVLILGFVEGSLWPSKAQGQVVEGELSGRRSATPPGP